MRSFLRFALIAPDGLSHVVRFGSKAGTIGPSGVGAHRANEHRGARYGRRAPSR